VQTGFKTMHAIMTFGVFFPSLATAFSVVASLEMGGRKRGGKGLLGWFVRLPWGDPSVAAQLLAMITFVFGGATGLVNASYTMNQVIHNTTWIPGHFHMTVGTAVALTFMGVAYWLVPYLTGRALWSRGIGLASSWIYAIGTLIFARGMISAGLEGMPRRIFRVAASYDNPAWDLGGMLTAVGGTLMFFGIMLFFLDIGMTIIAGKKGTQPTDVPVSETLTVPARAGWETSLDRLGMWVLAAIVLIVIAYGPFFVSYGAPNAVSPPFRMF
jgi:cytochrome c oxidase subunit 1